MRRITALLFLCFSISGISASDSITNADRMATDSFQNALNKKTIDVILVSRNVLELKYSPIQLDEIALIFACLAVSIHSDEINEIRQKLIDSISSFSYDKEDMPNISSDLKPTNEMSVNLTKGKRKGEIIEKFNEYCEKLNLNLSKPDAWKIIIFNEMFFSKTIPLTLKELTKIKDLFFCFLNDDNILLHINFLYTKKSKINSKEKETLLNSINTTLDNSSNTKIMPKILFRYDREKPDRDLPANSAILKKYKQYINGLDDNEHNTLFNRSIIVYNNEVLSYYDKSTYCREANKQIIDENDDVLQGAYIYNIGNGKDLMNDNTKYPKLSKLVIDNISSEICYDLTIGIRKRNKWINGLENEKQSKIHIYSSNTSAQSKSQKFPTDKVVACVDPHGAIELGNNGKALSLVFKEAISIQNETVKTVFPQTVNCFNYGKNCYRFILVKNILS